MPWFLLMGGIALALFTYSRKEEIVAIITSLKERVANILPWAAQPYVDLVFAVASEKNVDPVILLAIMARESNFGSALKPVGPGGTGDSGHGRGLMQIDDRSWTEWLRFNDWTDPYTNVSKGAEILRANMDFFSGRGSIPGITAGGLVTVSAAHAAKRGVAPGQYPDPRALSGDALTAAALAAYNSGPANVLISLAVGKPADFTTAHGDYSSWVMSQAAEWSAAAEE